MPDWKLGGACFAAVQDDGRVGALDVGTCTSTVRQPARAFDWRERALRQAWFAWLRAGDGVFAAESSAACMHTYMYSTNINITHDAEVCRAA